MRKIAAASLGCAAAIILQGDLGVTAVCRPTVRTKRHSAAPPLSTGGAERLLKERSGMGHERNGLALFAAKLWLFGAKNLAD